ncbi:hypothetical protein F4561_005836 [Lipingzhangella halophila]|uniref:Glycerophosphoryl diester phosphodiesterase family protein n=1 Tax=Lipingzhangella halophila TaxID=1783352 RepID=A0A7W7RNE3_9ACTN|nr:hypothetical protein [Lipingzhangella halophila]MBB4934942.1 hypothetical protein [Lipingzhangella halophila]
MRWVGRGERAASAVEYGGVLALVAAIFGGLLLADIPGRVVAFCESAICRVTGGEDCSEYEAGAWPDPSWPWDDEPDPDLSPTAPARPPIEKPGCPDPDTEWIEGLHAHNDYENGTPLDDALDNGAVSVEADVWVGGDGELWVKHDEYEPAEGNLETLYTEPLIERAEENGGDIYSGRDEPFQLVVEIKDEPSEDGEEGPDSDRRRAYEAAFDQVEDLPPGVEVVFSGGAPPDDLVGYQPDNATFDIEPGPDCTLPDKVNFSSPDYDRVYAQHFSMLNGEWGEGACGDKDGDYEISDEEQQELNEVVEQAHASGMTTRFWGAPDGKERAGVPGGDRLVPGGDGFRPCFAWEDKCQGAPREAAWGAQLEAGVDFYNTNHLTQSGRWLKSCGEDGF